MKPEFRSLNLFLGVVAITLVAWIAVSGCSRVNEPLPTPPAWLPENSSVLDIPKAELERVALLTIPAGKTVIVPVRIKPGEKYMLSWKLVSGPTTIGYMVRDPEGIIEFGLGGLTAVSKGRYNQELRYFCFINDTKSFKDARVAVGTFFYDALPVEGSVAKLPLSGKIELQAAPQTDLSNVMPVLVSRYAATVIDNLYFSPVFSLSEGEAFSVMVVSDAPIGIHLPPRASEHKTGPDVDISQVTRYNKDRAEWSYLWGRVDVKGYNRLDGGKRVEMTLIARPDNNDVDMPGLYQLKVVNGDASRPHWFEYVIKPQ
ncbi:MAG: hypothetical protein AB1597_04055 [Chloroflexota bacterium]